MSRPTPNQSKLATNGKMKLFNEMNLKVLLRDLGYSSLALDSRVEEVG